MIWKIEQRLPKSREKLAPVVALIALCFLWAANTLRFDLFPRTTARIALSPIIREASLLAIFAVLAGLAALIRKTPLLQPGTLAKAFLAGFGLFVLPLLFTELGRTVVDDSTRVALFSLTPLFAVIFAPYIGDDTATEERGGFAAAMIAVAGTALVFPIEIPNSAASFLAFCGVIASAASIAAANCFAVSECHQIDHSPLNFAVTASATASLCLGVLGVMVHAEKAAFLPFDAWLASDLFALGLLFWLMPRMSAVRMTTRFLIAPLLANLVGLAILRPHVSWQSWLGLLMIASASAWLLFAPD